MLSLLGTRLQPPVLYPLPADRAAAFTLPGGEGQPGLVAGCGWLCFMPCFQPPADVSPGSSSSSPCSELGDQHTRLCCTAGKLRHGAATWFARTANPQQSRDPDTRALTLGCAIHPCGAGADARGACPAPCPSAGGGLGAPCPWPGSSAALAHGWAVLRCQAAVTRRDGWLQSAFLHYK